MANSEGRFGAVTEFFFFFFFFGIFYARETRGTVCCSKRASMEWFWIAPTLPPEFSIREQLMDRDARLPRVAAILRLTLR